MVRRQLYDMMQQQQGLVLNKKLEYLENVLLRQESYTEDEERNFKQRFSYFKAQFKEKWSAAQRIDERFRKTYGKWLEGTFEVPKGTVNLKPGAGRPTKSFDDCSERSKRRKTKELRESAETEELTFATQMKLRASGKTDASKVVKDLNASPKRATKYRKAFVESLKETRKQLSPLQALSMFVEAGKIYYYLSLVF